VKKGKIVLAGEITNCDKEQAGRVTGLLFRMIDRSRKSFASNADDVADEVLRLPRFHVMHDILPVPICHMSLESGLPDSG
jgi:hypothetical protein